MAQNQAFGFERCHRMLSMSEKIFLCLLVVLVVSQAGHGFTRIDTDVVHYSAIVEPDLVNKSVKGSVLIRVRTDSQEVVFDCNDLIIDSVVEHGKPLRFSVNDHKLKVSFSKTIRERQIEIQYHGTPRRGIRFYADRQQVYTIFSTSQWMVCIDDPADKATFTLKLVIPSGLTAVGNGELVSAHQQQNGKRIYEWRQRSAIPSYIFGFAVGPFKDVKEKHNNVTLQYLATNYSEPEVRRIFRATPDMLDFFEARAGVKYADKTYTQVLAAGGGEQEMSSFTGLRESYGKDVLPNEQELWLGAPEVAHQWRGNMATCRDGNHC